MKEKKIGLFTGVAACVGLVIGSNCFLSVGQGTAAGGKWFLISLLPVALCYLILSFSLSELNDRMPEANGLISEYLGSVYGPALSLVMVIIVYFVSPAFLSVAEISLCSQIIVTQFIPHGSVVIISCIFVAMLTVINLMGTSVFAKVQDVVFAVMLFTLIALSLVGCLKLAPGAVAVGKSSSGGFQSMMTSIGFSAFIFLGIDMVVPLAKDMRDPHRQIRQALLIGVALLLLVYGMLSIGLMNYLPLDVLGKDVTPNITYAKKIFGSFGYYWMGIATIFAAISTANTSLASCPRIIARSAEDGMLPAVFAKFNKKGANYNALFLLSAVQIGIIILAPFLDITTMMNIGLAFYLVVYIMVNVAVLKLRRDDQSEKSSGKAILKNIPQIASVAGFAYVLYVLLSDGLLLKLTLIVFLGAILFSALWCIKVKNVKPFRPTKYQTFETLTPRKRIFFQ